MTVKVVSVGAKAYWYFFLAFLALAFVVTVVGSLLGFGGSGGSDVTCDWSHTGQDCSSENLDYGY